METEIEGQDSQEEVVETPTLEEHSQQDTEQQGTEPQESGGYNPAWEPLRQELGLQFEAIKPELAKIDKSFNEHITKVNAKYEPWKAFDEQGITPDNITMSLQALQRLDANPEEAYQALGKFLEENGRLPKTQKEAQEALDDAQEDDDDEYLSPEAKKIKELEKQIQDFQAIVTGNTEAAQQAAEEARQIEINRKAEESVASEYKAFQDAHPEMSQEDWAEIQKRHYLYALQGPDKIRSLEDVGKEYFALTERIRSAPRPNDLAPRLPGAGGAVPASQRKDPSEFSREESQDALAELIMRNK